MNTPLQAANNADPLQSIGQAITGDLRAYIDARISFTLDQRPTQTLDRIQTAALLKISLPTLLKRVKDGSVPCTRLGRRCLFERSKIDALLQSNGVQL